MERGRRGLMFWSLIAGAMNSQRARAHLLGASRRIIGLWEVGGKGGRPCVYVTSGNSSTYTLPCARNNSSSILRWLGNRDKEAKEERLFGERGWAVPKLHASSSDRTRSLDKIHFWRQDLHHYNPLVPLGIRHSDVSNTSLFLQLENISLFSSWNGINFIRVDRGYLGCRERRCRRGIDFQSVGNSTDIRGVEAYRSCPRWWV